VSQGVAAKLRAGQARLLETFLELAGHHLPHPRGARDRSALGTAEGVVLRTTAQLPLGLDVDPVTPCEHLEWLSRGSVSPLMHVTGHKT
jgi:hypothetical protein